MRLVLTRDPRAFAARAQAFLADRLERNVLATVLLNVLDGTHPAASTLLALGFDDADGVRLAALRTPPFFMLASDVDDESAPELVSAWLREDPSLPGVNATPETARSIAAAWGHETSGSASLKMREAMHTLEHVRDPPRPPRGRLRTPVSDERALLIAWMHMFAVETGAFGAEQAAGMVDTRLARGGLVVWDDGGPVSLVGTSPRVGDVVRVGPVYTPPERRGRGYAGGAVAAASRLALAQGARRCMLFTDVLNPTSNKIYAEVGYRRIGDWEEYAFEQA